MSSWKSERKERKELKRLRKKYFSDYSRFQSEIEKFNKREDNLAKEWVKFDDDLCALQSRMRYTATGERIYSFNRTETNLQNKREELEERESKLMLAYDRLCKKDIMLSQRDSTLHKREQRLIAYKIKEKNDRILRGEPKNLKIGIGFFWAGTVLLAGLRFITGIYIPTGYIVGSWAIFLPILMGILTALYIDQRKNYFTFSMCRSVILSFPVLSVWFFSGLAATVTAPPIMGLVERIIAG